MDFPQGRSPLFQLPIPMEKPQVQGGYQYKVAQSHVFLGPATVWAQGRTKPCTDCYLGNRAITCLEHQYWPSAASQGQLERALQRAPAPALWASSPSTFDTWLWWLMHRENITPCPTSASGPRTRLTCLYLAEGPAVKYLLPASALLGRAHAVPTQRVLVSLTPEQGF